MGYCSFCTKEGGKGIGEVVVDGSIHTVCSVRDAVKLGVGVCVFKETV